jgi:ribonuclease HIII
MSQSACFTATVDLRLADKLKADLVAQGFAITRPPYTVFSAKKKGISCTLYESGKLTVQGKEKGPFIEFYLEPEILQEFTFSHPEATADMTPRIGMDEAGKGDFFGPLCVAALYADASGIAQMLQWGVRDSKRFSDDAVLKLAKKIRGSYSYTVIRLFPKKYNELHAKFRNLNRLLGWAHAAALTDLSHKTGCKEAILDQFADRRIVERQLEQKQVEVHLVQRTKGEQDVVVAGASILARAAFLEGLAELSREVGIELPKGAAPKLMKESGAKILARGGPELLATVAKTHFKTHQQILDDSNSLN